MSKIELSPKQVPVDAYKSDSDVTFRRRTIKSMKTLDGRLYSAELKITPEAIKSTVLESTEFDDIIAQYSTITQTSTAIQLSFYERGLGIIPSDQTKWQQGTVDPASGVLSASTTRVRTIDPVAIKPSTRYYFALGGTIECDFVYAFYTSSNVYISGSASWQTKKALKVTTPSNAAFIRVAIRKDSDATFAVSDLTNVIFGLTEQMLLAGANYVFDSEQFGIYNNAGALVFSADVDGNLDITGKITAKSGVIGGLTVAEQYMEYGTGVEACRIGIPDGNVYMEDYIFYAGGYRSGALFSVKKTGYMKAASGSIAGWVFDTDSITKGNASLNASGTNGYLALGGATLASPSGGSTLTLTGALVFAGTPAATNGGFNAGTNITTGTTRLNYNGYLYAVGLRYGAGGNSSYSDRRLKENIEDINMDSSLLYKLSPKKFTYIDSPEKGTHYGLIAQEVEEVLEKFNMKDVGLLRKPTEEDEYYGLDYTEFIPMLINEIQNLNAQVQYLRKMR